MFKLTHSKQQAVPDAPAAPAAAPAPAADDPAVKWDALADDTVEDELPQNDGGAAASPAPESAPPATPVVPAAVPPPETPPAQPVAPTPPTPPAPTPEEQAAATEEARKHIEGGLTKYFEEQFDDETKSALMANPEQVMGKLMARAAMAGAQMALAQVPRIVPQLVQHTARVEKVSGDAWSQFDKANPDLAKPEYRAAVAVAAQSLKAMGKKLDDGAAITTIGRMVRAANGLPDPGTPAADPPPAAPPAPFTPVARGNSAPAAPAKAPTDKWADLAGLD